MVALHSGAGQVVDVNLLETMFQLMGPLPSVYAVRGEQQPRLGAGLPYTVPRGTYRCRDGRWIAVSTSSDSVAARVVALLGCDGDDRFATFSGRAAHRDELEAVMAAWCAERTAEEALATLAAAEAAAGPVMDMADIAADPHYAARAVRRGRRRDADAVARRPAQRDPGALRWAGRPLDADGADIRAHGWSQPTAARRRLSWSGRLSRWRR